MEVCYEYLGCDKKNCIMHGRGDNKYCWKVEGTLCNHHGIEYLRGKINGKKEDACIRSSCIYYKEAKDRNLV